MSLSMPEILNKAFEDKKDFFIIDYPKDDNLDEDVEYIVCSEACEKKLYKDVATPLCSMYNKES